MAKRKLKFAMCLDATGFDDLEAFKVYAVLPDEEAAADEMLRVVDESGEDYLYPQRCFVFVELPRAAERAVANQARALV